ncbi:TonB-dependent receptor [Sphingomonas turrisvirgatae]|nr:TonB-dependent receptor [Sphingomonas turrisvirgatae]
MEEFRMGPMGRRIEGRARTLAPARSTRAWLLACAATAIFTAAPALAQEANPAPEAQDSAVADVTDDGEILVTARRRAESLQDVPVAITALEGETLRNQAVVKVEDLARVAPGFSSSQSVRGGSSPSYSIRGLKGATSQTLLLDPAVGIYFADFNLSRGTGTNQSLYDLQSVQVLRGPQGTLFGRNSTGGAVLVEPNRPSDRFEGYVELGAGNYEMRDVEGMINIPIGDAIAIRAAGKMSRRNGYMHDVVNDRYANELDATSARLSIRLRPSDNFESTFIGSYYKGGGADAAMKLYVVAPDGVTSGLGPARAAIITALQSELARAQALGPYEYRNQPGTFADVYDRARTIQNNTQIELGDTPLGKITLKNVIGYRDVANRYPDPYLTGSAVDLFHHEFGRLNSSSWSEEFQIQGDAGKFDYVLGAYYFKEQGTDGFDSVQFSYLASPEFLSTQPQAVRDYVRTRYPVRNRSETFARNQSYAAFLHAEYDLSDLLQGLNIAGGIRVTHDKRAVVYRGQNTTGMNPTAYRCVANSVTTTSFDRDACAVPTEISYTEPTYDASLSYKISPDVLTYLSYNVGYRAGGFNNSPPITGSLEGVSFEPEFVKSLETGLKSNFRVGGARVRFNAAAFYEWFSNIQRQTFRTASNGGVSSGVNNASSLRMYGGEFELSISPTRRLQFSGSYAFIRPKYTKYTDIQVISGVQNIIDLSDAPLGFVPYNQYSASVRYDLPLPESAGEVSAFLTWSGQSGMTPSDNATSNCGPAGTYFNCLNRLSRLPGFSTVNFRLDWRNVASAKFDLALFVNNLTDEVYYPFAQPLLTPFGTSARAVGAPRTWGVSLRVPFGDGGY